MFTLSDCKYAGIRKMGFVVIVQLLSNVGTNKNIEVANSTYLGNQNPIILPLK